ncbi:MAG: hypothetical protein MZW92_78845 [Comamonadaceae bacterium]|nr:hypothetical protein [Comamonadaceae bacterium]
MLVATARSMRPKKAEEPAPRDTRKRVDTCPFCVGNEDKTPPAIAAYPPQGGLAHPHRREPLPGAGRRPQPRAASASACSRPSTAMAGTR